LADASHHRGKPYLAFDLGAESGRAVLGELCSGQIAIREIHRFPNQPVNDRGSLHWDVARLWLEICRALAQVQGVELGGIGVDAWGVDYALLGERGELLQNPYHYRDKRTAGVMESVFQKVPREEIYRITGIQFMPINTLYQLYAAQRDTPELLRAARTLLTIPDLFHYWLSGKAVCEFTNASTTQMVGALSRSWACDLLERLQLPSELPAPIVEPGTVVGALQPGLTGTSGRSTPVIVPASHDTGSAFAAIAACDGVAFISSGTWSLIGTELDAPLLTDDALRLNFTNEGGVCGTTRFLKNVMGLWMLQGCRRAWSSQGKEFEYEELMGLADAAPAFGHLVDPDDGSFLNPADMTVAIHQFCSRTDQRPPKTSGAYVRAILESLALKYRAVIDDLERVTAKPVKQIRVVGGGSKNRLLNQFTADATGRTVLAGPAEATALGNIAVQILASGGAGSLSEVRAMVERSFPATIFEPRDSDLWTSQLSRFQQYQRAVSYTHLTLPTICSV